jgi:hypothetical protein
MRRPGPDDVGVVELRQYTLRPGRRDDLVAVFDAELVETQEELGGYVLGQLRDLDDPDRFVWFRGFDDMASRLRMLGGFYGGPVWAAHGPAANATMLDSDDVLLLRPVLLGDALGEHRRPRRDGGEGAVGTWVLHHDGPVDDTWVGDVAAHAVPALVAAGVDPVAVLRTLEAVNDFPRLPVRAEHVVVIVARADDPAAVARAQAALDADGRWRALLRRGSDRDPQRLRLSPTGRSALR